MPAPVCVACGLFFKNKRNGVTVEERMQQGDTWVAYKLWHADLKECEGCGTQIITGFGTLPLTEHFMADYAKTLAQCPPLVVVDDCGGGPFNAERAAERRAAREHA